MRSRGTALGFAAALVIAAALPGEPAGAAPLPTDCSAKPGGALTTIPWPQKRLDFQRIWSITKGRSVTDGKPVVVAVIDSGMDTRHPQLRGVDAPTAFDVIDPVIATDRTDCVGHGTGVISIIAAQPDPQHPQFVGVAPQVQIVPIKQTNAGNSGSQDALIRGIDQAIKVGAKIANISLGVTAAETGLLAAVRRANAAGMIIVAAAGNDGNTTNLPEYPAAYATTEPNVIAVSASDESDNVTNFSVRGNYVSVAAPGQGVVVAGQIGGFLPQTGTSFAAPFVTGTAALVLAAHPGLTPLQVRTRIETTADSPPTDTTPDPKYGFGVINPYLAVTDVHTAALPTTAPASASPLPARAIPAGPDHRLQHIAIGVSVALVGIAAVLAVGAAVFRGRRPTRPDRAPAPVR